MNEDIQSGGMAQSIDNYEKTFSDQKAVLLNKLEDMSGAEEVTRRHSEALQQSWSCMDGENANLPVMFKYSPFSLWRNLKKGSLLPVLLLVSKLVD